MSNFTSHLSVDVRKHEGFFESSNTPSAEGQQQSPIENIISKIGAMTARSEEVSAKSFESDFMFIPKKETLKSECYPSTSSKSQSKSSKLKRRRSRSHTELAATTVGLREIAKKLGNIIYYYVFFGGLIIHYAF